MKQLLILLLLAVVQADHLNGINYHSGMNAITSKFESPIFAFTYDENKMQNGALIPDQIVLRINAETDLHLYSHVVTKTVDIKDARTFDLSMDAKWKSIFGSMSYEKKMSSHYFSSHNTQLIQTWSKIKTHDTILQGTNIQLMSGFAKKIYIMDKIVSHYNISDYDVKDALYWIIDDTLYIYGTHYVWRVTSGGILSLDYVMENDVTNQLTEKQVRAHASAGFASLFKITADYNEDTTTKTTFEQSIKDKYIKTCGGDPWNENSTLESWEKSLENKPCVIDYDIRSNSELINEANFPDIDPSNLYIIRRIFVERELHFYEMNTIHGCTDPNSLNFLWYANIEDGSCQKEDDHLHYGGYFRTSNCDQYNQVEHLTQNYACHTPYVQESLYDGIIVKTGTSTYYTRKCHHHWFHKKCRNIPHYQHWEIDCEQNIDYCTYYGNQTAHGYYFGGMYSPMVPNIITGEKSCPRGFHDEILFYYDFEGNGIHICQISWEATLDAPIDSVKFGGIFNCQHPHRLTGDYRCPSGYMKHYLGSVQGCDWFYCVLSKDMKHKMLYYPPGYGTPYPDFPFESLDKIINSPDVFYEIAGIEGEDQTFDDGKENIKINKWNWGDTAAIVTSVILTLLIVAILVTLGICACKAPKYQELK